ncbi:MAG: class I SAM-dependent methyltransferase [Tenuifilaceae bacterium]|jgi:hypothetical protein|nr:class I SAM-dependent methyltransferase [Tenuifilaceae bacterium]
MDNPIANMEEQLEHNAGKNLFCGWESSNFSFTTGTQHVIAAIRSGDLLVTDTLRDHTVQSVLESFFRVNQYYSFSKSDKQLLYDVYKQLVDDILAAPHMDLTDIARNHFLRLQQWLRETNLFASSVFPEQMDNVSGLVPCSEYSAMVQLDVLGINASKLLEPILDIGCGEHANLVTYLRTCGLQAYGMDRFNNNVEHIFTADWMEYTFEPQHWGSIISNLSFANHFVHHHMRNDGNFLGYAKKYMEILESLVVGGTFYYAPSLPFIEPFLDPQKFVVQSFSIAEATQKASRVVCLC